MFSGGVKKEHRAVRGLFQARFLSFFSGGEKEIFELERFVTYISNSSSILFEHHEIISTYQHLGETIRLKYQWSTDFWYMIFPVETFLLEEKEFIRYLK